MTVGLFAVRRRLGISPRLDGRAGPDLTVKDGVLSEPDDSGWHARLDAGGRADAIVLTAKGYR
jgi:hypothetical protein